MYQWKLLLRIESFQIVCKAIPPLDSVFQNKVVVEIESEQYCQNQY